MKYIYISIVGLFLLFSCEDKVDISKKLESGKVALAVEAILTNNPEKQAVKLTTTQYYFDNSGPKMAKGATVMVTDLVSQTQYSFPEQEEGIYLSPFDGDSIFRVGREYQLTITYNNETYVAYSKMNRIVPIDSIKFEQAEDGFGTVIKDRFNAEFFATDPLGIGDRYWVRSYKNDVRNTKPSFIGLGYDANLGPSGVADDMVFTLPLRQFFINEQDTDDKWKEGDKVTVELYSITNEAAFYLNEVVTQSSLGTGGAIGSLFTPPPANVSTNIKNTNEAGSTAVGFFCTSAVSRATTYAPLVYYR